MSEENSSALTKEINDNHSSFRQLDSLVQKAPWGGALGQRGSSEAISICQLL